MQGSSRAAAPTHRVCHVFGAISSRLHALSFSLSRHCTSHPVSTRLLVVRMTKHLTPAQPTLACALQGGDLDVSRTRDNMRVHPQAVVGQQGRQCSSLHSFPHGATSCLSPHHSPLPPLLSPPHLHHRLSLSPLSVATAMDTRRVWTPPASSHVYIRAPY